VVEGLGAADAIKFVLVDEADYLWAASAITARELSRKTEVLLSPVHGKLDPQDVVRWMLRDRLPARLNVQLHKYIWGPQTTGV
jgi:7-carboxy-7-deazaguanine synthase